MSAAAPALWLAGFAYGRRVLRGGEDPWADPASLPAFQRELTDLLAPAVVELDADATLAGLAPAEPAPPEALLDLVEDDALAGRIAGAIAAVADGQPGRPLGLTLPGAARLVARHGDGSPADEDLLDDLAVALTGLVRAVHAPALAYVLLREDDPAALALHEPLVNLAGHYDLTLCAVCPTAGDADGAGMAHVYRGAAIVPPAFWQGEDAPVVAPAYAELPADLQPEAALTRLAELRARLG